jgi:hypothetical protein
MKKVLLFLLLTALFSCSSDDTETQKYITDNDFKIEITSWVSYSDLTDDGIENYTIDEQGSGGIALFDKKTGKLSVSDDTEDEFATNSNNGLLIFDNYWGTTPKIIDFTIDNQYTILYDSRNDPETTSFELSKTIGYFKKI